MSTDIEIPTEKINESKDESVVKGENGNKNRNDTKPKDEEKSESSKTQVAQHYNNIPETGLVERTKSRIFYLRNFNNWAKSCLIGDALQRLRKDNKDKKSINVLDLCCGKGGDLLKWKKGDIDSLVCVDIADVSLDQCRSRYLEMMERNDRERRPQKMFTCEFYNGDMTRTQLNDLVQPEAQFDLCSCQFALHYCFESLQQAKCMLKNACESLRAGAYFIGTILNDNLLVNLARRSSDLSFTNEVCSIKFELDSLDSDRIPLFGAKYHFTLDKVVNLPEYLVHFPLLVELLKEFDMELIYLKTFPELVQEKAYTGESKSLLARMQALEPFPPADGVELIGEDLSEYMHAESVFEDLSSNAVSEYARKNLCLGTLSKSEWEVARMYSAFMFRKKEKPIEEASDEAGTI